MGPIYEERLLLDDPLYALEVHLKICMWIMNTMHYCVLLSLYQDSSITYLSDCYLLLQEVWQHLCWTVLVQIRLCWEQNFKFGPKSAPCSDILAFNIPAWVGLGLTVARMLEWCSAPLLRIVPWTPTITLSSKALPSGEVYLANDPFHSCKYSTPAISIPGL